MMKLVVFIIPAVIGIPTNPVTLISVLGRSVKSGDLLRSPEFVLEYFRVLSKLKLKQLIKSSIISIVHREYIRTATISA